MAEAPLIKADDVAMLLGVSRAWVFRAAKDGLIPSVRMGRVVRFRPADVQEFIDASVVDAR